MQDLKIYIFPKYKKLLSHIHRLDNFKRKIKIIFGFLKRFIDGLFYLNKLTKFS